MRITKKELLLPSDESLSRMRQDFNKQQSLYLPGFVDSSLLDHINAGLQTAKFHQTKHLDSRNREFARDETIDGRNVVTHVLHLMLNNPALFSAVRSLTESPPIGSFVGRIYRSVSGSDHHLSWHDDSENPSRLIGLSINFSKLPYSGGLFQIRDRTSRVILNEIENTQAGGAIIFRISAELQHRITAIEGDNPKIAGAGWFSADANGLTNLMNMAIGTRQL